jgi:hypothetical protein
MLEKTILEKYFKVVLYLKEKYVYDINSTITRSELYKSYKNDQICYNLPNVLIRNMGFIVRYTFSRNAGVRTQHKDQNGKRRDCYFLKPCKFLLICCFLFFLKVFYFFSRKFSKLFCYSDGLHTNFISID